MTLDLMISLPDGEQRIAVTGVAEQNLKIIRESLSVHIIARNGSLRISGDRQAVGQTAAVLERLKAAASSHKPLGRMQLIEAIAEVIRPQSNADMPPIAAEEPNQAPDSKLGLDVYLPGKCIKPLTAGQRTYLQSIQSNDLVFCSGPAGTGKTYLAVAAAVAMLKRGEVRRLVLARPAVEAGEKLGHLPGSMQDKVNPYLRPLLDALHDMMEFDQIQRFMAIDLIEIIPLAFMRGRTLNQALVILDEAQNTTRNQMLMFLTRLGHGSKMIVTGDTSQIDLEDPTQSGLVDAIRRLQRTPGVDRVSLGGTDIVRHSLVQRIVTAYGEDSPQSPADGLEN